MSRLLMALAALFLLTGISFAQEDTAAPGAEAKLPPEIEADTKAMAIAHGKLIEVLGADQMVKHKIVVISSKDGKPDPETDFVFEWKEEEAKDGEPAMVVITVGRGRLRDEVQFPYDVAHMLVEIGTPKLPEELYVREPIAMIATFGGEKIRKHAKNLVPRGGPFTLKEAEAILKARREADPAKSLAEEEKTAAIIEDHLLQATWYVVGYDLHVRGVIKRFYTKKITADELKAEIDPVKAWERQKDRLLERPKPPEKIDPATIAMLLR